MEDQKKVQIATNFTMFAMEYLEIEQAPSIVFTNDNKWCKENKTFGQYAPQSGEIVVYIKNRNMADILRTLCHEMIHHRQNEEGRLDQESGKTGSAIENEANSKAGIMLRNYGALNDIIYESKTNNKRYYDLATKFEHYFGVTPKEYILEHGNKCFTNAASRANLIYIDLK